MAITTGLSLFAHALLALVSDSLAAPASTQAPVVTHASNGSTISVGLFRELEELARIVDISYCVGTAGLGIKKPFECASRCGEFENFELVNVWSLQHP